MAITGRSFPSRQSLGPRAELAATVPPPVLPPPLIVVQGVKRDHAHREHRLPNSRFNFQYALAASIPPPAVITPLVTVMNARGRSYRHRTPVRPMDQPVLAASVPPPVFPPLTVFAAKGHAYRRRPLPKPMQQQQLATVLPFVPLPQMVFQARGHAYRRRTPARPQLVASPAAFPSFPFPRPLGVDVRRLSELRRPHSKLGVLISEVRTVVTLPPARPNTKPRLVLAFRETIRDIRRRGLARLIRVPRHIFTADGTVLGGWPERIESSFGVLRIETDELGLLEAFDNGLPLRIEHN